MAKTKKGVTRLKGMQLSSVDLVRAGANQQADICLFKGLDPGDHGDVEKAAITFGQVTDEHEKQEKLWKYTSALSESIFSIRDDNDLDRDTKASMMLTSLRQFSTAMEDLIEDLCGAAPRATDLPVPVGKSDPNRFDYIEEVQKFNPYHGPDGRFTSASGGASASGGVSAGGKGKNESDTENAAPGSGYKEVGGQEMHDKFYKAYDSMTDEVRWRVGTDYGVKDYEKSKCLVTAGGSTIAIKPDGDIVSVCKAKGDTVRASDMLKTAVENGGTKLDAFGEKLYNLYTKNGFEPVSQCKFVDEYAPDAWIRANGFKPGDTSWHGKPDSELKVPREDITFFKYTGKKTTMSYEEFHSKTELHNDYDVAQGIRDGGMN